MKTKWIKLNAVCLLFYIVKLLQNKLETMYFDLFFCKERMHKDWCIALAKDGIEKVSLAERGGKK